MIPKATHFTALLDKNISSFKVSLTIRVKSASERSYEKEVLKAIVNTCKVQNGIIGNFIVSIVKDRLEDYSNYKFECSLEKKLYYAQNFPICGLKEYFSRSIFGAMTGQKPFWEVHGVERNSKLPKSNASFSFFLANCSEF